MWTGKISLLTGLRNTKATATSVKQFILLVLLFFQDEENKENGNLVFQFCFEYSYDTDEYKCYSKYFSDEIIENDFAYFIVENYEQSCSCLLYTSPSPRDQRGSRMPSSA